jgi:hypothetical protein
MGTIAECALISPAVVLMHVIVMAAPAQRLVTHLPHRAPTDRPCESGMPVLADVRIPDPKL